MNVLEKIKEVKNYYKKNYGIKLTKKQLKVLKSKDEIVRETFLRQEGCSTAAMIKAIEFAINNERSTVLFINANKNTAYMRKDDMKNMLLNKDLKKHVLNSTKNPAIINFINGSQIKVISGYANVRGLKADCVIIEPAGFIGEDVVQSAMLCNCHSKIRQTVILN